MSADTPGSDYRMWQQGDYALECGRFVFCAVPEDADDDGIRADGGAVGFAVITQTCDVVRDSSVVPYVTVAALIEVELSRLEQVRKGASPRLATLHDLPDGVVVDLTRVMSVDKSLLNHWDRRIGCPTDNARRKFAWVLERAFGRYAFPDQFVTCLEPFRRHVTKKHGRQRSELGFALNQIEEFRVVVHTQWDDPIQIPISFFVIVSSDTAASTENVKRIHGQILIAVQKIQWVAPFCMDDAGIQVTTYADLSAHDYLDSFPLSVNDLSNA
ncbi:MAG: hypothetical protein AAFV54_09350 [Pseudomonadota bacterium]